MRTCCCCAQSRVLSKAQPRTVPVHIRGRGQQRSRRQSLIDQGAERRVIIVYDPRVQEAIARGAHQEGVPPRLRRLPAGVQGCASAQMMPAASCCSIQLMCCSRTSKEQCALEFCEANGHGADMLTPNDISHDPDWRPAATGEGHGGAGSSITTRCAVEPSR